MGQEPYAAKPKRRRWYQFSLRQLLLLVTLFCICFNVCRKVHLQTEAVAAVRALGGNVKYDYQIRQDGQERIERSWLSSIFGDDFSQSIVEVSLCAPSAGKTRDSDLISLVDLPKIKTLDLYDTEITHKGVAVLSGLKQLENLDLSNTRITAESLKTIGQLSNLKELSLRNDSTTYASNCPPYLGAMATLELDHTVGLPGALVSVTLPPGTVLGVQTSQTYRRGTRNFEWYCDHQPRIDDAGLAELLALTRLESLDIEGTDVTSQGIARLACLSHLTYLNIRGTNVSDAAIAELKKALPNLKVDRYFPATAPKDSELEPSNTIPPVDILIDNGTPGQSVKASDEKK